VADMVQMTITMPEKDAMLMRDRIAANSADEEWHMEGLMIVSSDGSTVPVRMSIDHDSIKWV
jgi:hypothetical protein